MTTVLVIDDNASNRKLAVTFLTHAGYEVLQADQADEGLALARSRHPDAILMDIQMPGLSGLDAAALLKRDRATADIRILAVTAFAMKGDRERILAAGLDGYIAKPIQYQPFIAAVAACLAQPGGVECA